ncbi:MAG: hypothetical protein Q9166_003751 [cf. Caloplaca sp. 2 TL-2023]
MDDIQGVDYSRYVTQDCEEDIDAEVGSDALLEKNPDGRDEDGADYFDDIAANVSVSLGTECYTRSETLKLVRHVRRAWNAWNEVIV